MGSLFSKPKPKAKPKPNGDALILEKDKAVLSLKVVRDKLRRYQVKLGNDSDKLELQAKELIALKLKNRALLVLKLKRFKQKELDGIEAKLATVQTQIRDVEWASINVAILNAIDAGTKELNRIHEERSLEDVQQLMDDTNEAIEVENRINLVLAGQLSTVDESELELELELILKGIAASEPKVEVKEVEAETAESEAEAEAVTTEPDVEEDVEQDYSSILPEVPDGPLPSAVTPKTVTPRTPTERTAVMS